MSLRARLLLGMTCIAVVLVGAALLVWRRTEANLVAQVDAQLRDADVPRSARTSAEAGRRSATTSASARCSWPSSSPTGRCRAVRAQPERRVARAARARRRAAVLDAPLNEPFTVGSRGRDLRYRALVRREGPNGALVLALPLDDVDEATRRLLAVEAIAVSVVLGVLALVTWWVIRLGVRPIKRMTATASAIAEGSLSHRVDEVDPRHRGRRARHRAEPDARRASRTASTSARAPRSGCAGSSPTRRTSCARRSRRSAGYAELYRDGGLGRPRRARRGDAAHRGRRRSAWVSLVDDLLHLARLDQGRPMEREPVDLVGAGATTRRATRVRSIRSGRSRRTTDDGRRRRRRRGAPAAGRRQPRHQRARAHRARTAPITLTLGRAERAGRARGRRRGPGMEADDAARAFERFYRADPSRSRHSGGSGLGLAIVEATVRGHGGDGLARQLARIGARPCASSSRSPSLTAPARRSRRAHRNL